MIPALALRLAVLASGLIWRAAFARHAPQHSDTAAIAAHRLRRLR